MKTMTNKGISKRHNPSVSSETATAGITLIALIITILVLLILTGVSIATITGENGIIAKAESLKEEKETAEEQEIITLAYNAVLIDKLGDTSAITAEDLENQLISDGADINTITEETVDGKTVLTIAFNSGRQYQLKEGKVSKVGNIDSGETIDYSYLFDFDPLTGTILGIKEEYMKKEERTETDAYYNETTYTYVYYYESGYDDSYKYSNGYGGCVLEDSIDTLIVPNEIDGVKVDTVEYIGALNVRKVVFEDGIENIEGAYNFINVSNTRVCITDELEEYVMLEEIVLPNSLLSIGSYAFGGCASLTSIDIPNSVTSIGNYAFSNCKGLTSIDIPSSVATMGNYAFSTCPNLKTINISNGVTSIGNSAFFKCEGLTSIDIPSSVTRIESYAFTDCPNLKTINIDKASGTISGSPWGATSATVNWTGTN